MSRNTKIRVTGFTLVELLVVIAIIALLLSILMPSLQKAREQAKKVVCGANLKQQALATSLYMQENKDRFPAVYVNGYPQGVVWAYWSWGGQMGKTTTLWNMDTGIRMLNPYVGRTGKVAAVQADSNLKVFRCPSDIGFQKGTPGYTWPTSTKTNWDDFGYSYRYNADAMNNDSVYGLSDKPANGTKKPDKLIIAGDFILHMYLGGGPQGGSDSQPCFDAFWHNKKERGWTNVFFADSHFEYINISPKYFLKKRVYYTGKTGWTFRYNYTGN